MSSPTSRSLELLRSRGYRCEITERWNPFARRRVDLFGFVDIIAVREGETLAVQTTSAPNVSARIRKIQDSDELFDLRRANWSIHVHGWAKRKGRWVCREENIS